MENGKEVLEALDESRVVEFSFHHSGGIKVEESCDNYFSRVLTPDQVRLMAAELVQMADEAEKRGPFPEPQPLLNSQMILDASMEILKGRINAPTLVGIDWADGSGDRTITYPVLANGGKDEGVKSE